MRKRSRAPSGSTRRRSSSCPTPCRQTARAAFIAAGRERLLHVIQRRWPLRELLRRQPPTLCRQRGEGDGVGEGRLPSRRQPLYDGTVFARCIDPGRTGCRVGGACAAPRRRFQRARPRGCAAHADHRRSDRPSARRRPALPSGPVLPAAELRIDRCARRRSPAADGGHRVDRCLGRPGKGTLVADRLGARRVEPARRVPEEGRACRRDGPDRRADNNSPTAECAAARRRPGQCRAVLNSQGDARGRQPCDLFRRLRQR